MKLLIKKNNSSKTHCFSYYFCTQKEDFHNLTEETLELPVLKKKEAEELRKYQHELVSELRKYNKDNQVFISSPLGCENMWQSDFFIALENLFRLNQLLGEGNDFMITCQDLNWTYLIKFEAEKRGYNTEVIERPVLNERILNRFYKLLNTFKNIYHFFRNIINLSLPMIRGIKTIPDKVDFLFLTTWLQSTLVSYKLDKLDPFFGDFPTLLQEKGNKVAVLCHIDNFTKKNLDEMAGMEQNDIYTYYNFLTFKDILLIFQAILLNKVKFPAKYFYLKKCIKNDISKTKWIQSVHALMIKHGCKKFMKVNPALKIIHTFEGNCWEKGVSLADKELPSLNLKIYGYQHTSFSEFHQKLKAPNLYFPKKIISSGNSSRQSLIDNFFHDKNSVISGCYLRATFLSGASIKKKFPHRISNILVLLQGTPYDNLFLKKIEQYIDGFCGVTTVRLHPASQNHNFKLPKNFSIAYGRLHDNLTNNDIVLHNGTTAAIEAAFCGTPTIYLDLGFAYTNNTLLGIGKNLFAQIASQDKSFKELTDAYSKNTTLFEQHLHAFRQSYQQFFNPPTESAKESLISLLN